MIKLGTNNIDKMYLGETQIAKAYLGETLVYDAGSSPTPPPIDPYADWCKIKTKNVASGKNCFSCNVSQVSRMLVDGVEVTPVQNYTFSDNNYHDVYILFSSLTSLPDSAFNLANYTIKYADIPASYTTFGASSLRGMGGSQRCDVIIRSTTYPSFGSNCFLSWTLGHLWVPDSIYDTYISNAPISTDRIHKLSDWST